MTYEETLQEIFNNMMKPPSDRRVFMIGNEEQRDCFGAFLLYPWGFIRVNEGQELLGEFDEMGICRFVNGKPHALNYKLIKSDKWFLREIKGKQNEKPV